MKTRLSIHDRLIEFDIQLCNVAVENLAMYRRRCSSCSSETGSTGTGSGGRGEESLLYPQALRDAAAVHGWPVVHWKGANDGAGGSWSMEEGGLQNRAQALGTHGGLARRHLRCCNRRRRRVPAEHFSEEKCGERSGNAWPHLFPRGFTSTGPTSFEEVGGAEVGIRCPA